MVETISPAKEVKARKIHQCNFCAGRIVKSEKYVLSVHSFDGEIYNWRAHTYCDKIANRLEMYKAVENSGCGLSGEDFAEFISNEHFKILIKILPEEKHKEYGDIISQLSKVNFRDKLMYVVRYYNRLDDLHTK